MNAFHRSYRTTSRLYKEAIKTNMNEANLPKHYLVPCCEMVPVPDKSKKIPPNIENPKVIIIGAGMAGLSAAARLVTAGITDLVIIEAKDRPGGRIHSYTMGMTPIELGADGINGACIANPVYTLACLGGNLQPHICRKKKPKQQYYLTTDGLAVLNDKDAKIFIKEALKDASSHFNIKKSEDQNNLMEFIQERLKDRDPSKNFLAATNGILNKIRARWGEDLEAISLREFGSFIDIPGGFLPLNVSASSLLQPLLSELKNIKFKYCTTVQNIRYGVDSATPRAIVRCCDGTELPADYVIVTVSLGVLKTLSDTLFLPALPCEKINAIRKIGFGSVTRIYLEYPKPFWPKGEGVKITISWNNEDRQYRDEWVKGISSIEEIPGELNVLRITIAGKESGWVESIPMSNVAEEITDFLRRITGDGSLPCPIGILRSKWSSDIHFKGANSFLGLGSGVKDQCALAYPVPGKCEEGAPVLLFAGEATCPGHFSTLQGARLSGIREAERIIDLTLALEGPPRTILPKKEPSAKPCGPTCIPCVKINK